ncbi:MAG: DUF115 domain-containing protein [Nitrospinae bacterium]|nr:DUF115 domain-containing protein [Nitrospinota bacterium]
MEFESRLAEVKTATIDRFSEAWLNNYRANRPAVLQGTGVPKIRGQLKDIPCILVGAGPSLDKNLKFLKWAAQRSIIVACDAALATLLSEGIKPNFVTVLDPQESIIRFFWGIDTRGLRLVAPTIVHPKILRLWKGAVLFFNKFAPDIPVLTQIQKDAQHVGVLTPGGSVLTISYDLAFQLGANPIIFIGQDLSFPKGKGHTTGTVYDMVENDCQDIILLRDGEHMVMEKNIFGRETPTLKSMSVTKTWFNWAFKEWSRPNPSRPINCSEDGILSGLCEQMPLAEGINLFCGERVNVEWKLEKLLQRKAK